tara:strand:+ start:1003 stop:1728 length:726 start_codon:yes stop_codon:yes gene_type:complete
MKEFKDMWKEACWKGYKQVGTKKKGDKVVPNCVPEEYDVLSLDEKAKEFHLFTNKRDAEKKAKEIGGKVVTGTGKSTGYFAAMKEDAPANAVAHGGVSMPPDAVQDKKRKKEILTRISTKIKENTDNNNAVLSSVLDNLDKLDVIVDELTYGKSEPEFVVDTPKKSILEKAKLKDSAFGSIGSGSMGSMHPIASLGDTTPNSARHGSRKIGIISQKDPRQGIDQNKKTHNLKVVKREDKDV